MKIWHRMSPILAYLPVGSLKTLTGREPNKHKNREHYSNTTVLTAHLRGMCLFVTEDQKKNTLPSLRFLANEGSSMMRNALMAQSSLMSQRNIRI